MDNKLLDSLLNNITEEYPGVLITIIKVIGSTPRGEGAQMLIFPDGKTVGSIGGGCGEADVKRQALINLDDKTSKIYQVNLNSDIAADEGMVCGGMMDVLIEPISDKTIYAKLKIILEKNQSSFLLTDINNPSDKCILDEDCNLLEGKISNIDLNLIKDDIKKILFLQLKKINNKTILIEPILPGERLLVLGAGYVGQAVANMGKMLDFHVTVVDDRVDFANKHNFPNVDKVICDNFAKTISNYRIDKNTYIVIVTRGHKYDEICLKKILRKDARYVGMIGSRRRVKLLLNKIEEQGYSRKYLDKIKTPIGLKIGAETPAEIGISILGEIITVRNKVFIE